MELNAIISDLKSELERINRALAALVGIGGGARRGRPKLVVAATAPKTKHRRGMSAGARKRISIAMKKRWAERKKAKS